MPYIQTDKQTDMIYVKKCIYIIFMHTYTPACVSTYIFVA